MTPLTPIQFSALATIQAIIAKYSLQSWLKPSYVMAHCRIESGWQPTIKGADFATTGSVGLMQVTTATLAQMTNTYVLGSTCSDQSIPDNSLLVGTLTLRWTRQFLMNKWGFHNTVLYKPVCEGFNEGVGNILKGRKDDAYYLKWCYAQQGYAFVDAAL